MKKAFTLIELIVVVFIIGILALLIIYGFNQSKSKNRDSVRKQNINQIKTALMMYYTDQKPNAFKVQTAAVSVSIVNTGLIQKYIANIPSDPTGKYPYLYQTDLEGQNFAVFAALENGKDSDAKPASEMPSIGKRPSNNAYNYFLDNK